MKASQFRKWLESQDVEIKAGSKHDKLYYQGKQSTLPRHKGEIPEGTRRAIVKQLGLSNP
ncbi:MAG: type II toxin-antitoxin system HicA family toxin [Pseudomonadales bacterium]